MAARRGLDAEEVLAGMADPAVKEKVKTISEEGVARGVFGSPFVLVDGEPFWGWDRLAMVDRWLARGNGPLRRLTSYRRGSSLPKQPRTWQSLRVDAASLRRPDRQRMERARVSA